MSPKEAAIDALENSINEMNELILDAMRYMSHPPTVARVELCKSHIADYEAAIKWVKAQK